MEDLQGMYSTLHLAEHCLRVSRISPRFHNGALLVFVADERINGLFSVQCPSSSIMWKKC